MIGFQRFACGCPIQNERSELVGEARRLIKPIYLLQIDVGSHVCVHSNRYPVRHGLHHANINSRISLLLVESNSFSD